MTLAPNEADSPPVIDANSVLPFPVTTQRLQVVPRRGSQNPQVRGGMKLKEFAQRHPLESTESRDVMVVKKLLGLLRAKTPDHTLTVLRVT
jgi:hypothetical protein